MAEIKSLLDDVIETEIQNLEGLLSGSDEKSKAIQNLATLHKLRIEEIKAETEAEEKRERRAMDSEKHRADLADRAYEDTLQEHQLREQKIDRYARIGVALAELTLPLIFYGIWMNRGFKFEETGVYASTTFKNLLNRFRPTK